MNVSIRWMIRRDLPEVLAAERAGSRRPMSETRMLAMLRNRNVIGMVAERGEKVVGFMVYELYPVKLHVHAFAAHPDFRRVGVGAAMVNKLIGKLNAHRRYRITVSPALLRDTTDIHAARDFLAAKGFDLTVGYTLPEFRVDPDWLLANDGLVMSLARSIRRSRSGVRLPILADALEDAGCDNQGLLTFLRGPEAWAGVACKPLLQLLSGVRDKRRKRSNCP